MDSKSVWMREFTPGQGFRATRLLLLGLLVLLRGVE